MLKALKIRLYPNKTQEVQINKLLGCYRFVYNQCLNRKITSYEKDKTSENLTTLGHYFHVYLTKQDEYNWLNEQNTKVLKQSIIDMLDAYKHFFEQHNGYPKYKSKHDNKQSCRFEIGADTTTAELHVWNGMGTWDRFYDIMTYYMQGDNYSLYYTFIL